MQCVGILGLYCSNTLPQNFSHASVETAEDVLLFSPLALYKVNSQSQCAYMFFSLMCAQQSVKAASSVQSWHCLAAVNIPEWTTPLLLCPLVVLFALVYKGGSRLL
eukprot:5181670-Amphidinium_carterae.1